MSMLLIGHPASTEQDPGAVAGPSWLMRLTRAVANEYRARLTVREIRALDRKTLQEIGLADCRVEPGAWVGHA